MQSFAISHTHTHMNLPLTRAESGRVPSQVLGGTPWLNCMVCSIDTWTYGVTLAGREDNSHHGVLPMAVFCDDCLRSFLLKYPCSPRTGGPWKLHPLHKWVQEKLNPQQKSVYSSLAAKREARQGRVCSHCYSHRHSPLRKKTLKPL